MEFTHDGRPRSQDKDESLCAFRDPALHGIAEENGNADHGTPVATIGHLRRRQWADAHFDVSRILETWKFLRFFDCVNFIRLTT